MSDPGCSRSTNAPRAQRIGVMSGLLLVLPLVLGARDCERDGGDDDCDQGECAGSGGAGGSPAAGRAGGGEGCLYAGERHDVGDRFPSDDGCNTCSCTEGGQVACTLRACAGGGSGVGAGGRAGGGGRPGGGGRSGGGGSSAGAGGSSGGGGSGDTCGGLLGLACDDGEYCNFSQDAQCGAADQTGTCEPIPQVCTKELNPVCGCDDTTYDNPCGAAANGVSIAHPGECDGGGGGSGSGQTCGGIASLECADPDEFCNYDPNAGGQGCDGTISDAGGVCQTRPQICTRQYDPVCGCDRRTYGNDCEANAASQSVMREGQCTELDCADIGGHAVDGFGPAPVCPQGEVEHGTIRYSNGMIAIEGTICCVPQ